MPTSSRTSSRCNFCLLLTLHIPILWYASYLVKAQSNPSSKLTNSGSFIVQLSYPPAADVVAQKTVPSETLKRNVIQQHKNFATSLRESGIKGAIELEYLDVFNGVSLNLFDIHDSLKLKSLPDVENVYPVDIYGANSILTSSSPRPEANKKPASALVRDGPFESFSHQLSMLEEVRHTHPHLTGKGIKVGVIDSGIDYLHPAFSLPGQKCEFFKGPGCRVQYGRNFVKDSSIFTCDPMDKCYGHGTSVAGIIGGKDINFEGVAPEVTFGAYRVLDCKGEPYINYVLAALNAAYEDGMHIVNISLGFGKYSERSNPLAMAIDNLAENGVVVIMAAGNDGLRGLNTIHMPSNASKGISVMSYDNHFLYQKYMKVTGINDQNEIPFMYSTTEEITSKFPDSKPFVVIASPQNSNDQGDGCLPYVLNAQNAGALGVLIYGFELTKEHVGLDPEVLEIPVAFASLSSGEIMFKTAKSLPGSVQVTFVNSEKAFPINTGGVPSILSSMGLDMNLFMKPDIGAPGENVITTTPVAQGSYVQVSGTSVAAPHIVGAIALDLQNAEDTNGIDFASIQRRLHITSSPSSQRLIGYYKVDSEMKFGTDRASTVIQNDPIHKISVQSSDVIADSVAKIGSGLINVSKFLFNRVDIQPSKLELGDGDLPKRNSIKVINYGSKTMKYAISHLRSESLNVVGGILASKIETLNNVYAGVTFNTHSLIIPPGQTAEFLVTVTPNNDNNQNPHCIQSGFIQLHEIGVVDGTLSIPYALMTGDYSQIPIWKNPLGAPALYTINQALDTYEPAICNSRLLEFNLMDQERTPALGFHLIFPLRKLEAILWSVDKNFAVGLMAFATDPSSPIYPTDSLTLWSLRKFVFDMTHPTTRSHPVNNGCYKIIVKVVLPQALMPVRDVQSALITVYESPEFLVHVPEPPPLQPQLVQ